MALYVNTNVSSISAQRNLNRAQGGAEKALQRLSTGMRVNSASDDAAGLAIGTRFQSQIRSLEQAQRNANDAISVIQTAEGGMAQMSDLLIRMRELSVQSANGTLSAADRISVDTEFDSLVSELDRIAQTTSFNGTDLLDGDQATGVTFQVGAGSGANDRIVVSIASVLQSAIASQNLTAQTLSTVAGARTAMGVIDSAISTLSTQRSKLGASQNRLTVTIENLGSQVENLSASRSRIVDADVAKESANLTKYQILVQAGLSVVAQANASPQAALSLL
jgi:flagellin